jgi:hypothetical protein
MSNILIRRLFGLAMLSFVLQTSVAQDCNKTSTGRIPINDLGTGTWEGMVGGLYPSGSNDMPETHRANGVQLATTMVVPRNTAGQQDATGKVVMLSIGMSNCNMAFSAFRDSVGVYDDINPALVMVNGAQGSMPIDSLEDPNGTFWQVVNQRLQGHGVTAQQVQVVWFKQAQHRTGIPNGMGINHIDTLEKKFLLVMQILRQKYPNLRLLYCSGRSYGDYAIPGGGNPEPYAYMTGWAHKRLIARQIDGDSELAFAGAQRKVPWMAWSGYFWADGENAREDGLQWLCSDYSDGTHPNAVGLRKQVKIMLDFFRTDATATPWFMQATPTARQAVTPLPTLHLFPNPATGSVRLAGIHKPTFLTVRNAQGAVVATVLAQPDHVCTLPTLAAGVYVVQAAGYAPQRLVWRP